MTSVDMLSGFVATVVVVTSFVVILMTITGIRRLARQPGVLQEGPGDLGGSARIARVDRVLALVAVVWVGGGLLSTFVLDTRSSLVALLYIFGLAAIGYGLVVLTESGRRLLRAAPQTWLIGAQTYRIVGGVFLIAAAYDAVPAYFAIPAGWGDLITGIGAVLVAAWWAAGALFARRAAWVWNLFGLFDLIVAVGIGTSLFAPVAAALFGGSPPWLERAALGFRPFGDGVFPFSFPLAFVPVFIVPLSITLHLLSMRKLALGSVPRDSRHGSEEAKAVPSDLGSRVA